MSEERLLHEKAGQLVEFADSGDAEGLRFEVAMLSPEVLAGVTEVLAAVLAGAFLEARWERGWPRIPLRSLTVLLGGSLLFRPVEPLTGEGRSWLRVLPAFPSDSAAPRGTRGDRSARLPLLSRGPRR